MSARLLGDGRPVIGRGDFADVPSLVINSLDQFKALTKSAAEQKPCR